MPAQIQSILDFFKILTLIDYKSILADLNNPIIYISLGLGVFVIFLSYASFKKHMFHTSVSGAGAGFIVGILITLATEAIIITKLFGMNSVISLLQGKKVPEVAQETKSIQPVLGESTTSIEKYLSSLTKDQAKNLKLSLCQEILKEVR